MAPQYLSTWEELGFLEAPNNPQFPGAIGGSTSSEKSSRSLRVDLHDTIFVARDNLKTSLQLVYDCRVRCDNHKSCPRPVVSFMSRAPKIDPDRFI